MTASDATIEGSLLATHWIVTDIDQSIKICGGIENKNWKENIVPAGEAIGALDLVKVITAELEIYKVVK